MPFCEARSLGSEGGNDCKPPSVFTGPTGNRVVPEDLTVFPNPRQLGTTDGEGDGHPSDSGSPSECLFTPQVRCPSVTASGRTLHVCVSVAGV